MLFQRGQKTPYFFIFCRIEVRYPLGAVQGRRQDFASRGCKEITRGGTSLPDIPANRTGIPCPVQLFSVQYRYFNHFGCSVQAYRDLLICTGIFSWDKVTDCESINT